MDTIYPLNPGRLEEAQLASAGLLFCQPVASLTFYN